MARGYSFSSVAEATGKWDRAFRFCLHLTSAALLLRREANIGPNTLPPVYPF